MIVPTYYQACRIFEDSCFAGKMRAVQEDVEGLDIESLRQALRADADRSMQDGQIKPVSRLEPYFAS